MTDLISLSFQWPSLVDVDLRDCCSDISDIISLSKPSQDDKSLLWQLSTLRLNLGDLCKADSPNEVTSVLCGHSLPNLKQLLIFQINEDFYAKFITYAECSNTPNIKTKGLSIERFEDFEKFPTLAAMPMLTDLIFSKTYWSECDLAKIAENAIVLKLSKLDVSHSSGITGNLSVILCHSLPSLNSLILSNCGLNSQDLCSMAQASVEGRVPELKHLDISENIKLPDQLEYLFSNAYTWQTLLASVLLKLIRHHNVIFSCQQIKLLVDV